MKQLLTILLLLPWGLQAQETCDTDYRSPRIHYYVSCPDGSDTRRQADPGQAVRAGSDIWILLLQDDGNAVLAKHAGKNLHYGIREREEHIRPAHPQGGRRSAEPVDRPLLPPDGTGP